MKRINRRGNHGLDSAPMMIVVIGVIFLFLATIALINQKFGDEIIGNNPVDGCNATNTTSCGPAFDTTQGLNEEIAGNTSIAGIILTVFLVGLVLTILIGIAAVAKSSNRS